MERGGWGQKNSPPPAPRTPPPPPSSRSGAQRLPECGPAHPGAAPSPSCSRSGWGVQQSPPPSGMLEEGWIQPRAERQPELGTLCPRRCPSPARSCPLSCCSSAVPGPHGGNLLHRLQGHPLSPALRPLPAPFLFQEGSNNPLARCRASPGAAGVGEWVGGCQAKGIKWLQLIAGGQLDPGPQRDARSKAPVLWCYPMAGRKRRDEAGGLVLGPGQQDGGDMRTQQLPQSWTALAPQRCKGWDGAGHLQLC